MKMTATKEAIREWLFSDDGRNCTHMIVVCDTFDHENYPVYVKEGESIIKMMKKYDGKNMQRIDEVYNYNLDLEEQLNSSYAMNV